MTHSATAPIPTSLPETLNVAAKLTEMALSRPQALAVAEAIPRRSSRWQQNRLWPVERPTEVAFGRRLYRTFSFQQLNADSSAIAAGLRQMGVEPCMRLALLVRPGIDFVSLVFALLKVGAVQVLIDPGMGMRQVLRSLAEVKPRGFIGIPTAQMVRQFRHRDFTEANFNVVVGGRSPFSRIKALGEQISEIRRRGAQILRQSPFDPYAAQADSQAAIIFTSGSTGPAKGVLYRHGNFTQQVKQLRDFYGVQVGEIDVSCFPLFGLFNAAMGVSTVFPRMDFSRPARVDPRDIVATVNDWQATQAFGSPAVWNVVGKYCEQQSARLPTLRRVLSAGAPVAAHVLRRMTGCIHPAGTMHTPYGATEALPVASISAADVLGETIARTEQGGGVCVGRRFEGLQWRVIRIHDGPIHTLASAEELARGEIGELIVCGPAVTTEYVTRTQANALAKIHEGSSFWHRMGDVGYLDEHDRFWFCGRMSQRVMLGESGHNIPPAVKGNRDLLKSQKSALHASPLVQRNGVHLSSKPAQRSTLFTIPCEAIFNRHPAVFRSALVGVGPPGQQRPAIVVEPLPDRMPHGRRQTQQFIDELRELGRSSDLTAAIGDIFIRKTLPVDVRHNVKINREYLAVWAAKKMR